MSPAGRGVTRVRGAVTAKVQGHERVPIPSTDHMVSAGSPAAGSRPGEGGRPCAGGRVARVEKSVNGIQGAAVRGRTGSSPTGAGGGGRWWSGAGRAGRMAKGVPARVRGNREHGGGDALVNTGVVWPADVKGERGGGYL